MASDSPRFGTINHNVQRRVSTEHLFAGRINHTRAAHTVPRDIYHARIDDTTDACKLQNGRHPAPNIYVL